MDINYPKTVLISRTDSVGDMVLTLPMVTVLKQHFPAWVVGIMGTEYTRPVVEACSNADGFVLKDDFLNQVVTLQDRPIDCIIHVKPDPDLAKRALQLGIRRRIGTINRCYHWLTCNRFVRLSRSKSRLHEAQLNLVLLRALGIDRPYSLAQLAGFYQMGNTVKLPSRLADLLNPNKFKLILHPKSRGSAREWGLENFALLINGLDPNKFQVFISGTEGERESLKPLFAMLHGSVTDLSGQMTLAEFIAFIAACDGLVACSTGPIHIASALQKHALGLYPPMRPLDPGRWGPIGAKAQVFVLDKECNDCRNDKNACACMQALSPNQIIKALEGLALPGNG